MTDSSNAYAKINLSLDILSKMDDGYHNIQTVMQSITLCDEIVVECKPGNGVTVETNLPYLPRDERNIAAKAAMEFYEYAGISGYMTSINIRKRIPVCAGLGGGSADGACILHILNRLFETNLSSLTLQEIGASFGSDVPFCVVGGTMLAEGRGERLTMLPSIPLCYVVVCKPSFSCSTPELFRLIKCDKIRARPDTAGIISALEHSDLKGVAQRMYNVFEDVLPRGVREIDDIKYVLLDNNALGAVMTGSGPSVIGLFSGRDDALSAHGRLASSYRDCFLCETIGDS